MNKYYELLQKVSSSSSQVLSNQYSCLDSPEIQEAAHSLQTSIQPCLDELKQSAQRLKSLIDQPFRKLDHAQDVWQSKQKISDALQSSIWEDLADLTGAIINIRTIIELKKAELKTQKLDEIKKLLDTVNQQFFIDKKTKNFLPSIGWGDKEKFNKYMRNTIESFSQQVDRELKDYFQQLYENKLIFLYNSLAIEDYIVLLDQKQSNFFSEQLNDAISFIHHKSNDSVGTLGITEKLYTLDIFSQVKDLLNVWKNRIIGDISWNEVVAFQKKLDEITAKRIDEVCQDHIDLIIETIEKAISFYDYFLQLQERYRKENLEQHLAEKAWIDKQYETLQILQENLDLVLEA